MKLRVEFNCDILMSEYRKSYSGKITLMPGPCRKIFYFLVLNPYGGADAEFSIYEDEAKTIPLVEAVGEESTRINSETGLPITEFDFGIGPDSPNVGLIYVLANIISEAIYHIETMEAGPGVSVMFNHVWEQSFGDDGIHIPKSFLKSFC